MSVPTPTSTTAPEVPATSGAPGQGASAARILAGIDATLEWMHPAYEWFHAHPELSMQETETRAEIRRRLEEMDGFDLVEVGGGIIAVLRNGPGRSVLFRADFDGLPVTEATGVPYASTRTAVSPEDGSTVGVMHACGHDVHVTALLGACELMSRGRAHWSGTFMALFQPGEETLQGARAMVEDGLASAIPRPDVALGQHVMGARAGTFTVVSGPTMSAAMACTITLHGTGGHGSMPHLTVDPVLLAAQIVVRLQGIVARELKPGEFGVVTVGALNAGNKHNIIPETATLLLSCRAYTDEVRDTLQAAVERIVRAECAASGAPREPDIEWGIGPITDNDPEVADRVRDALGTHFGQAAIEAPEPSTGSEDFAYIPEAFGTPYAYWFLGGFEDPDTAPGNHSPHFAPVQDPTLQAGAEAVVVAALEFLD
ncbi:amidohydrolase [Brevibacterium litoralis]|uniref:amidohydrolase n=1 Tax=Brevibacterium litoralis TaxID=3138935 RepID=UPI0032EF4EEC